MKKNSKIDVSQSLCFVQSSHFKSVSKQVLFFKDNIRGLKVEDNAIAIISDGTESSFSSSFDVQNALVDLEEKALKFKQYAGVDAFPICICSEKTSEIAQVIQEISPMFNGINFDDIETNRCFDIYANLPQLGLPIFYDKYHGFLISLLAAMMNACMLAGKDWKSLKIVINGSQKVSAAIVHLLLHLAKELNLDYPFKDLIVCDSLGMISKNRIDILEGADKKASDYRRKKWLSAVSNIENKQGTLKDALYGADIFIGVSKPNILNEEMILTMKDKPIVFALAYPKPEIDPIIALRAGAFAISTSRVDFPNQINSSLVFPGIFKGALDVKAHTISQKMKIAAAFALAQSVDVLSVDHLLPDGLEKQSCENIAQAVGESYLEEFNYN